MTAQVGNDDAVAQVGEERGDVDEAVDVVRPAVQAEDDRAVGGTRLGVADVEDTRLDVLELAEAGVGARSDGGTAGTCVPLGSRDAPAANAVVCRPASETAVAPVPRPTALLKVRLLIM
ncbi:hypothetical protein GCM10020295_02500 [Streptomyces cinereospinus]